MELDFNGAELFIKIQKPCKQDLDNLELFELTSPNPEEALTVTHRVKKRQLRGDFHMSEWRKRLAMAPEDAVNKTMKSTTHYYVTVGNENIMNPRRHLVSRAPGLRLPRLNEKISSDTFSHLLHLQVGIHVPKHL